MPKAKIIVRDRNGGPDRVKARMLSMILEVVEVGVFQPELAEIVAWNELGTRTSPPRPFIRQGLQVARVPLGDALQRAAGRILDGVRPRAALAESGEIARQAVQGAIIDFGSPRNAPSTIAKKGRDTPLVDTGRMLHAISWRITPGGQDKVKEIKKTNDKITAVKQRAVHGFTLKSSRLPSVKRRAVKAGRSVVISRSVR